VAAHSEDSIILSLHRFDRTAECDRQTDRQINGRTASTIAKSVQSSSVQWVWE